MRNHAPIPFAWFLLFAMIPTPAQAQRGALIEDLFRTVAEAHLEREQRKQIERDQTPERFRPPQDDPTDFVPDSRLGRGGNPPRSHTPGREVGELTEPLVEFSGIVSSLIRDLRSDMRDNPSIRSRLPDAYQIAADTQSLIQRAQGMRSIGTFVEPYAAIDANWRQLSFRLRAIDGLSNDCARDVRSGDRLINAISKQIGIQPQFDRHALHDLMLIAGAHMQSLLDDLELARIDPREAKRLMHDVQLLRQQMLGEADRANDVTYEQATVAFTDFTIRWSQLSQQVYAINDPHLHRRLDRIRRLGDQTYQLLWIPPPYNASTLTASAQRLQAACAKLLDQLTIRTMVGLDGPVQVRLLESSDRLIRASDQFTAMTQEHATQNRLRDKFSAIDQDWTFIHATCRNLPTIQRATLAAVEHQCQDLRRVLGVSATDNLTIDDEALEQAAAALEGSAEYFAADLNRYQRYLNPVAYRQSISSSANEVHRHAKHLHEALHQGEPVSRLQREADHLLNGWQQLTRDLHDIESHGLSERRADSLRRGHRNMAPLVAQIAAALTPP